MENQDFDWGALEADMASDASTEVAEALDALAAFDVIPSTPVRGRVVSDKEREADDLYRMTMRYQRVPEERIEENLDRIHTLNDLIFPLFEQRGWVFAHGMPPEIVEALASIMAFIAYLDEHGGELPDPAFL